MLSLLQHIWPKTMDQAAANKAVKQVYYAATILSVVFFLTAFLGAYTVPGGPNQRLDSIDAVLFMILGYCVKDKDPYAATLLFALCIAETILRFSLISLPVWAVLLVLFANGVRGAFWLLRFTEPANDPRPGNEASALPQVQLDQESGAAKRPSFFGLSRRLNRRWYASYLVLLLAVSIAIMGSLYALFGMLELNAQAKTLLLGLCFLPFLVLSFGLTVQRCHDFNRSGWRALFLLLPLLGLLCFLVVPGSPGENKYGPPNR